MSKFFNETQKANKWAQQKLANQELDVRQMLESLKQGAESTATEVADVPLKHCRKVHLGNSKGVPLILRQEDFTRTALEAYRGLRTRLMRVQAKSGLHSIAITSSQPGEGKTLTVVNLGLCYSQLPGQRTLIIDADLRTRGLTQLLDNSTGWGLSEVLTGQVTPDEAILATDQENLFVLPAGSVSAPPPELFTGPRWQEFLRWCSESFKVVLVDTPPILPLTDFDLINAACDGVVMVVRAHHARRETLQKTAGALDSKKLLGIVFNGVNGGVKDYYGYGYGSR
jgi:capsular exopolysaccharide synthesis family protein